MLKAKSGALFLSQRPKKPAGKMPTRTNPAQFAPQSGSVFTGNIRNPLENKRGFGEHGRNRTCNLRIKSPLLCQLSYVPSITYRPYATSVGRIAGTVKSFSIGSGTLPALVKSSASNRSKNRSRASAIGWTYHCKTVTLLWPAHTFRRAFFDFPSRIWRYAYPGARGESVSEARFLKNGLARKK